MHPYQLKNALKTQKGSTLVGVVALAIILSIGALAYAALVRNVGTNETSAYYDAMAYQTAAQGALIADNWLSNLTNWESVRTAATNNDSIVLNNVDKVYAKVDGDIDDITCKVTLKYSEENNQPYITARSEAVPANGVLPYKKQVHLKIPGKPGDSFALFVDNPGNFSSGSNAGLHHRNLFAGPVHFNAPVLLSPKSIGTGSSDLAAGFRFYGDVSVWGGTSVQIPSGWLKNFPGGKPGTDYTKGVGVNPSGTFPTGVNTTAKPLNGSDLDRVFRAGFNPNADKREIKPNFADVEVPQYIGDATKTTAASARITFGYSSTTNNSTGCIGANCKGSYTSELLTSSGSVISGTSKTVYYDITKETVIFATSSNYNPADPATLTEAQKAQNVAAQKLPVTVMGNSSNVLAGKVTVVTVGTNDITLDVSTNNRLTYQGIGDVTTSKSSPAANDIRTQDGAGGEDGFTNVSAYGTRGARDGEAMAQEGGFNLVGADGKTQLNHIFAFYSGRDIDIKTATSGNPVITAQLFAMENNGTFKMSTANNRDVKLQVIGTSAMSKWWDTEAGTGGTSQNGALRTYFDKRRVDNRPILAPGLKYNRYDSNGALVEFVGRGGQGGGLYQWCEDNASLGGTSSRCQEVFGQPSGS